MSQQPGAPDVDPHDVAAVAAVLDGTWRATGPGGLGDLLARLPGARLVPGTPGRLFRPALPGGVQVGAEHFWTLTTEPVVDQHVVGGVVLSRTPVPAPRLGELLAVQVVELVREHRSAPEAALVLSAARDVLDRF